MDQCLSFFELTGDKSQLIRGTQHIAKHGTGPWVVFCHGLSGQRMGPGYLYVKISRKLAETGISSARFDFRGSGESDGLFSEMNIDTMKSDLLRVLDYIRSQHTPSSIILFGHSFGGLVVSVTAAESRIDGFVLLSPIGDTKNLLQRSKELLDAGTNEGGFYEYGPHEMALTFAEKLKGLDPVEHIFTNFQGQFLLFQGDRDPQISVPESARYLIKAKESNIQSEYHIVKGADHNYSRVSDIKLLCNKICTWTKERFQ